MSILITKYNRIFSIFICIIFLFSNYSCKKEVIKENQETPENNILLINKTVAWLDKKITSLSEHQAARIRSLKESLNFNALHLESYNVEASFIVIPIMNTFKSTNNSLTKTSNYLILVISNSGEIIKGNILQFIPPSGEELHVPKHTFSKIYNYQSLQCNGIFNILTIDDRFSYKLHFEQGTLKSVSVPKKAAINVRVMGCIDWYLVTTYYFDDGTSYTTESFVRRSCDNGPGEWQNMQPDDSGGGSPDQIVYEYEVVKDVIWNVGTSPTGIGEIKSTERAKGKRYTTMPGGYFTKFDHSYTICNFCSSYNNNVFTEQEAFATYQTSIATSSVKGVLYYDGNSYAISNAETWSFSQIFP